jgi:hypothetical protein
LSDYVDDVKRKLEFSEAIKRCFNKIADLPEWMQTILLEDINSTIENRIRTMEIIIHGSVSES